MNHAEKLQAAATEYISAIDTLVDTICADGYRGQEGVLVAQLALHLCLAPEEKVKETIAAFSAEEKRLCYRSRPYVPLAQEVATTQDALIDLGTEEEVSFEANIVAAFHHRENLSADFYAEFAR